jgi:hypothetical protein
MASGGVEHQGVHFALVRVAQGAVIRRTKDSTFGSGFSAWHPLNVAKTDAIHPSQALHVIVEVGGCEGCHFRHLDKGRIFYC